MSKVMLLMCALLIAAMISQGNGCECKGCGERGNGQGWQGEVGRRSISQFSSPLRDRQASSFNYTEMVDSIKRPGLISALMVYDTDKDGIISGEGK